MQYIPWRRWTGVLITGGILLVLAALIVPFVLQARDAARKRHSQNNLKQLGIALFNYYPASMAFPPGAVVRRDGTAMHGWYPQILPYIDANPYFAAINFNQPWDDPENAHIFRTRHPICLMPDVDVHATNGGFGLIHYTANPNVLHRNSHVAFEDMPSGASHNWLLGEAAGNYSPWGYPFNWRPLGRRLNDGLDTYGRPTGDGAYLLKADGTVPFIANDVDPAVLNALRDAPPVAAPELVDMPQHRFVYQAATWERKSLNLDDYEFEGLCARVWLDGSGAPDAVWITPCGKGSVYSPNLEDLRRVVAEYPRMRKLIGGPVLNDDAVDVLSDATHLELIKVDAVQLSEAGRSRLQRIPNLRLVCVGDVRYSVADLPLVSGLDRQ